MQRILKAPPSIGDRRTLHRFALWPIMVGIPGGALDVRWLEMVTVIEERVKASNTSGAAWEAVQFVPREAKDDS